MKTRWLPAILFVFLVAASPAPQPTADSVLAKMHATYGALKSYSDSGVVVQEMNGGSPILLTERSSFTTRFQAPRQFLLDFRAGADGSNDRFVIWLDGGEVQTWWKTTGVHDTYPKGQGAAGFAMGALPTRGSIGLIASLLFPGLQEATSPRDAKLLAPEAVDGHRCFKVSGIYAPAYGNGAVTSTSPVTLWIDSQTYLVRKIFVDTPRESPPNTISRATFILDPRADPPMAASTFQFVVPLESR